MPPKSNENAVAVTGPVWLVTTCLLAIAPEPYPNAEIIAAVMPIQLLSSFPEIRPVKTFDNLPITLCI